MMHTGLFLGRRNVPVEWGPGGGRGRQVGLPPRPPLAPTCGSRTCPRPSSPGSPALDDLERVIWPQPGSCHFPVMCLQVPGAPWAGPPRLWQWLRGPGTLPICVPRLEGDMGTHWVLAAHVDLRGKDGHGRAPAGPLAGAGPEVRLGGVGTVLLQRAPGVALQGQVPNATREVAFPGGCPPCPLTWSPGRTSRSRRRPHPGRLRR